MKTLSDKIYDGAREEEKVIAVEDVLEFIKEIKLDFINNMLWIARERDCQKCENIIFKVINDKAGKELRFWKKKIKSEGEDGGS